MEVGDCRTALAILKDEAQLERLYETRDQAGPPSVAPNRVQQGPRRSRM
jgi:hypothetical protein